MKKYFFVIIFICTLLFFYQQVFLQWKIPISADTIVGLYHPFRDLHAKDYPNGIPYKNFLITDPVRQQYPWRYLGVNTLKQFEIPLWNPYAFSGTPLLANIQSAVFYPLNIVFLVLPFQYGWSLLIILQSLLSFLFLYMYLRYLNLERTACFLGAFTFTFCGFSIAWLEWNTIGQTALWLPLILLCIEHLLKKIRWQWVAIVIFAACAQFFAGHVQVWFYSFLISIAYFFVRMMQLSYQQKKSSNVSFVFKKCYPFLFIGIVVICLTAIQWIPTVQLIVNSARDVDQAGYTQPGWFIPWQHLIQFVSPDFFGNPATLNYWGTWNYGELVGYVGILPLLMAIFACIFRHDKKTFFFTGLFILSLLFALPTFIAFIPFVLKIPFLSTAQPTRLLFVTDFSLAILAALGFDYFLRVKRKSIFIILTFLSLVFAGLWFFILFSNSRIPIEFLMTAKRNMIFPTIYFIESLILIFPILLTKKLKIHQVLIAGLLLLTVVDLIRFGNKFTPFVNQAYLFPQTKTINFLQSNIGNYRFMNIDSRILPPNFSVYYKLQSIEGYDPLYLRRYGELIVASERGKSNIAAPFGFNRILTPHKYDSPIINLLGVKYVLSLDKVSSSNFKHVFSEGKTNVYENKNVLPRAFFVKNVVFASDKKTVINMVFSYKNDLQNYAVIEGEKPKGTMQNISVGKVIIDRYEQNYIHLSTVNNDDGFFVLTDVYYPLWNAKIDGQKTHIYITDYAFRGIFVPKGSHKITFSATLF